MIDAIQTVDDCYSGSKLKPFTIKWPRLQRGLEDPFIKLMGSRPNSTTPTPNRPINFILTFGIMPESISTLPLNIPAQSDHIGMIFDLNMEQFFNHRAYTTYFKHQRTPHLYKYCDNSLCQFSLNYRRRATKKTIRYQNVPYISDLS